MRSRNERGFSLVEVIMSLGLLAMVLISLAGLMTLGHRNVKSGRAATEALAVGATIIEEMEGWGFRQTYLQYGFDGSANNYTVDTRTNAYASKWQTILDEKLFNSYAIIRLQSLAPSGTPPAMDSTLAIRVTVTVHWEESIRLREIELGMVKL